jgi:molecular chaperone GrpE
MSEQKQWRQRAGGDVVKKLLPVIDNLDRALSSADEGGSDESISQGIEMIVRQLREVLQKEGIERIEAEGVPFDPQYHEAVVQQETKDYEHNHVMSVFQHGYEFGSRVLRPARVVVAKNPEGAGSSPEQQAEEPKEAEEHE